MNEKVTLIVNGGEPLKDCPIDWDAATVWEEKSNAHVDGKQAPRWDWDCGFKLDYDGPLIDIESRFYPPKSHYGPTWNGTATLRSSGKVVGEKEFDCATLDQLKKEVEEYKDSIQGRILELFI